MEPQALQALITQKDFDKLKTAVIMEKALFMGLTGTPADKGSIMEDLRHLTVYRKQYEIWGHDVMDINKRQRKMVTTDEGTTFQDVSRLPIPLQKIIVSRAATFLCGNPIELEASPATDAETNLLTVLKKQWKDCKLDYLSKNLAKLVMSETECAELWYWEKAPLKYWANTPNDNSAVEYRLRMKVLAHSKGDLIYPVFDASGDMIAFGRCYAMVEEDKLVEHFDVYTDEQIFYSKMQAGKIELIEQQDNPFGKIPVIYYWQRQPEWHDVQHLIDRYEKILSNHGDTNDYFGSPIVKVKGKIEGFAKKGEQGKVIELEGESDANYMTWDQSPASVELEFKNLRSLIFDMTDTPDISIEQMKAIGTFSGIALKMIFMNAHMKASDKEESFGMSIQRRINFMKYALARINVQLEPGTTMDIVPKFIYYLPKDEAGIINMLTTAKTGGIISQETAVAQNPLVEDAETELDRIKEEQPTPGQALNDLLNQ